MIFTHTLFNARRETVKVGIDSHVSVIVHNVKCIAITARSNRSTAYVSVSHTYYRFPHYPLCLEIDS